MKFFTAATAALLAFAAIASAAPQAAEAVQVVKRACTPAPAGCVCTAPGQFCGAASSPCKAGHAYQCTGNSGLACEDGPHDNCNKCNKLQCP